MSPSLLELQQRVVELEAENKRLFELNRLLSRQIVRSVHEIRTSLTNVNLRLYLVEHARLEDRNGYLAELKDQSNHLNEIANQLLTAARRNWQGLDEDFDD